MLKNKLKSNEGSSMVLAIIAMVLVTLLIGTIGMQLNNQIKFNSKTETYIQSKYESQGGIENGIGEFINSIEVTGEINSNTIKPEYMYLEIIKQYVTEANLIIGNNGILNTQINEAIKMIDEKDYINIKPQLEKIINNNALNGNGGGKPEIERELNVAIKYIDEYKLTMDRTNCISNIKFLNDRIIENSENYVQKDLKNSYKVYVKYNEETLDHDLVNHFGNMNNVVKDTINALKSYEQNNNIDGISDSIKKIEKYEYVINEIMLNLNQLNSISDALTLRGHIYGNGNGRDPKEIYDIVYNRIKTISLELELMKENLIYLRDNTSSSGGSTNNPENTTSKKMILTVPKVINDIKEEGYEYVSKVTLEEYEPNPNIIKSESKNNYEFEILNKDAIIELNLSIESENDNYTTNSKVNIIISNIKDSQIYDVKYEVVSWN